MQILRSQHVFAAFLLVSGAASAQSDAPFQGHVDQRLLARKVLQGDPAGAFGAAFDGGDELFHFFFSASDGVGANVGGGKRFTRIPRADLNGPGEWAQHFPARPTGPNEQSCTACHIQPMDDGAGGIAHNVVRDPLRLGDPSLYIERQTPHLFGSGAVQRLAEEVTEQLAAIRDQAGLDACASGHSVTRALTVKGISFGSITANPGGGIVCSPTFDTSNVRGISPDLVVRPFGWKGDTASLREFTRNASHRELGMQPVEITGDGFDGDFDGTTDELTVGDVTGIVIYISGQPRPLTRRELAKNGAIDPLTIDELTAIERGRHEFLGAGCAQCHVPSLALDGSTEFSEPSQRPEYRDGAQLPAGQNAKKRGLNPALAVRYDLTVDLPDNVITDPQGHTVALGNFKKNGQGRMVVELFGDLRRHDMGPALAESVDEIGTGASVFLTENLWGVGSTAPYLHDGRATSLREAILQHGGEAQGTRDAFASLSTARQDDLIAFLSDMVLAKLE